MKLVTFTHPETGEVHRTGILHEQLVVDAMATLYFSYRGDHDAAARASAEAPREMASLLGQGALESGRLSAAVDVALECVARGDSPTGPSGEAGVLPIDEVRLLAPIPRPPRIRDYLTYEEHAKGAGLNLPPAFNEMPICYEANCASVIGPEDTIVWPAYSDQLDYEFEIGFFVGRGGRNLTIEEARHAIAGVTIFNDVSARDIQIREMSLGIGPSKGKDFCSAMGPWITTLDDLDEWAIEMEVKINGETWSKGTSKHRHFSFAEVLVWASYCEDVQPGEFIAVGTMGGGAGLELDRWISPGDVIELSSNQLGTLRNFVGAPEVTPSGSGLPSYTGSPRYIPPKSTITADQ